MLTLEEKDHNSEEQSALKFIKLLRQLSQHSPSLLFVICYLWMHMYVHRHTLLNMWIFNLKVEVHIKQEEKMAVSLSALSHFNRTKQKKYCKWL